MTAAVTIDPLDPTPPFEQVRHQFTLLIETGQLKVGERLPSVRQLAGDLGLAAGTVARAYRELEAAGLVVTRRGGGTRVAPQTTSGTEAVRALLAEAAGDYLTRALALGASPKQAQQALDEAVRRD